MSAIVDYQQAYEGDDDIARAIPSQTALTQWANAVLQAEGKQEKQKETRNQK